MSDTQPICPECGDETMAHYLRDLGTCLDCWSAEKQDDEERHPEREDDERGDV